MQQVFLHRLTEKDIAIGDCLIEVGPEGLGDSFRVEARGVVCLGHHPGAGGGESHGHVLTTAAWQAWLLVTEHPKWKPQRILRSTNVNLDDTLAALLVDPETRGRMLGLRCLDRLLVEVATVDVLGPPGYIALESRSSGATLVNAINKRAPLVSLGPEADRVEGARRRADAMANAMLGADNLTAEPPRLPEVRLQVLREDGAAVAAEASTPGGMAALYDRGYRRVILLGPPDSQGRRRCSVGQSGRFAVDSNGLLKPLAPIDWTAVNKLEPGWGGRDTIGGGPREGTRLRLEDVWEAFKIDRDEDRCKENG